MAKCWFCKTKKGKRYCEPLENVLCPVCCGENRLKKIDCLSQCSHLAGVEFQKQREEEKKFAKLMEDVPHGRQDDILHEPGAALMAGEIEEFIRDLYVDGNSGMTDKSVFESYKQIYKIHTDRQPPPAESLDSLTRSLLSLYQQRSADWEFNLDGEKIGRVFLRLMLSTRNMSGGRLGEFGYLNYLKNNFLKDDLQPGQFIIEDKFGNTSWGQL